MKEIDIELLAAAKNGYTETVKALIKAGADVNLQDKNRKRALDIAAEYDNNKFYNQFIDVLAKKIKKM
ncbi:MAG: ankyrin repeat domain-containing protein, partial [Rickettsiales bacterium]|nr:ankyrin repeat domain-containing protein [Rickettsiales bacterium]